jgi:hypothetical protein
MLWTLLICLWGFWVLYWFACALYRIAEDEDECR